MISLLGGSLRRSSQGATRSTIKLGVSVVTGKVDSIPRSFSTHVSTRWRRQPRPPRRRPAASRPRGSSRDTEAPSSLSAPLFLGNNSYRPVLASDFPFRKLAPDTYSPPVPVIQIQVQAANKELTRTVPLLLDTGCTTLELNPKILQECNMQSHQTTVRTVTTGGLAAHRVKATEIHFTLGGKVVGPLRALGKHSDVSSWRDGVIGQSLLKEFAAVELDYRLGTVSLYSDMHELPTRSEDSILAEANMYQAYDSSRGCLTGLYTVDVYLGGKGPVTMLVDTGGARTIMNWKGVAGLCLSKDSEHIGRVEGEGIRDGSNTTDLNHVVNVSSNLRLGGNEQGPVMSLAGDKRLTISIGDIPGIDALQIGGILGCDVLTTRCKVLRCSFQEPYKIAMYK